MLIWDGAQKDVSLNSQRSILLQCNPSMWDYTKIEWKVFGTCT